MVWSFAHLPLYLGIAIAGVGIEHVVRIASRGHLHAAEAAILCGAVTTLMLALAVIGASSELAQQDPMRWRRLARQAIGALLPLLAAPAGAALPLVVLVGGLAAIAGCQVWLAQFWKTGPGTGRSWYAANASEPSLPM
jgi:energy-converting hydrogenase Eha subunit C